MVVASVQPIPQLSSAARDDIACVGCVASSSAVTAERTLEKRPPFLSKSTGPNTRQPVWLVVLRLRNGTSGTTPSGPAIIMNRSNRIFLTVVGPRGRPSSRWVISKPW